MCVCVCVCVYEVKSLSCVRLFVTPWTAAYQASLSMGFSRQEYWSWLPYMYMYIYICMRACSVAQLWLTLVTSRTVVYQAPLSTEFSRQKYWVSCHFLLQVIFPTKGSNPHHLHWQVDSLALRQARKPLCICVYIIYSSCLLYPLTYHWALTLLPYLGCCK